MKNMYLIALGLLLALGLTTAKADDYTDACKAACDAIRSSDAYTGILDYDVDESTYDAYHSFVEDYLIDWWYYNTTWDTDTYNAEEDVVYTINNHVVNIETLDGDATTSLAQAIYYFGLGDDYYGDGDYSNAYDTYAYAMKYFNRYQDMLDISDDSDAFWELDTAASDIPGIVEVSDPDFAGPPDIDYSTDISDYTTDYYGWASWSSTNYGSLSEEDQASVSTLLSDLIDNINMLEEYASYTSVDLFDAEVAAGDWFIDEEGDYGSAYGNYQYAWYQYNGILTYQAMIIDLEAQIENDLANLNTIASNY